MKVMKVREEEKKVFCMFIIMRVTSLLTGTQEEGGLGAKSGTGATQGSALLAGGRGSEIEPSALNASEVRLMNEIVR